MFLPLATFTQHLPVTFCPWICCDFSGGFRFVSPPQRRNKQGERGWAATWDLLCHPMVPWETRGAGCRTLEDIF